MNIPVTHKFGHWFMTLAAPGPHLFAILDKSYGIFGATAKACLIMAPLLLMIWSASAK